MADIVEIFLTLRNARKFIEDARKSSKAVTDIGDSAEKSGKKAGIGWKGVAKWAGGAAAIYGAAKFLKGSVSATEELAKSTLALSRTTGLDAEQASKWATIAKSRGLATKQMQIGFVKLSREMEKSRKGTTQESVTMQKLNAQYKAVSELGGKKAPAALRKLQAAIVRAHDKGDKARKTLADLGVTQRALASGNTQAVIGQVAQALSKMVNPARRAATMQQLFGRGGQALLPILMKGRQGIQDQMAVVEKYGAFLGVKTVDQLKEHMAQERELRIAMEGFRIQVGQKLLPVIMRLVSWIVKFTNAIAPLTSNADLLTIAIGGLVTVMIAYKLAMTAAAIASIFFEGAVAPIAAVVFGIVLAVGALAIGFYFLYTRVGWFRNAVNATWKVVKIAFAAMITAFKSVLDWVRANWRLLLPLLAGPFGLLALVVIKHFGKIKSFFAGVVDFIRSAVQRLVDFIKGIPAMIGDTLKSIPGLGTAAKVLGKAGGLAGGVGGAVGSVFGAQHGGIVPYRSNVLVGEHGPEVLNLPTGATVAPLPGAGELALPGAYGTAEIVVPLYLNGRVVAQAVAQYTADKRARR